MKEEKKKSVKYIVTELYNQSDGFYPRVMSARPFKTKRGARNHACRLAKDLLLAYNVQVVDGVGMADNLFHEVWVPCTGNDDWGFDAVEGTINRDIRVVEVPL